MPEKRRIEEAYDRAISILLEHWGEWSSVLEAYWILRRHEEEIGFPLIYPMVEEIVELARRAATRPTATVKNEA